MNPKVLLQLLIPVLLSVNINAQDSSTPMDSVHAFQDLSTLPIQKRIDALNLFALEIYKTDSEQAFHYLNNAVQLANKENDPLGHLISLIILGDINYSLNRFDEALEAYQNAQKLSNFITLDSLEPVIYEAIDLTKAAISKVNETTKSEPIKELPHQRIYLVVIFVLMVIFSLLVYYDIRSKTKVNRKLAEMNQELEIQRDQLTQTVEELISNQLKYKNLVQNSPTGILYIEAEGKILEVNPTMLKILGSPGEAETKNINCLEYPPLKHIGIVDDIKSSIANGQTIHKEYEYTTKWGKEVYVSVYITPIKTHSGKVKSLILNIEDITISKRAEKLVQKSEEKYRMLVEYSLQAMMIIQQGKIIFANSKFEELTQYSVDELIQKGRQWLKLVIHPDDLRKSIQNVKDALSGKVVSAKNEYRIIRKDGKKRWIEALSSVVNYQDKRSMLVVAIDVTDRKEAETFLISSGEKLKQANAMKDKFFSIVAHDLKNPFNTILGFSNLLIEAYESIEDSQRKMFIKNICEASENTFKLLQNLLDWSGTQTGNIEYKPQTINLKAIAVENLDVMHSSAIRKKIKITADISKDYKVYADENMVKAVIRNLLSNAIKFTNKEGAIQLGAHHQNDEIVVWVKDNGIGIEPENLRRLFRIDEKYKTKGTDNEIGTGLGLILCKELVEKNNGKIWAESKPGKGSLFNFTLPVGK